MKIIGAGFCRTGTMSTRQALVDLGFDPCFHMADVHRNRLAYLFIHFLEGNRKPLLEYLAKNPVQAAVDFPMSAIVDQMLEYYPDAKILLNIRDSSTAWVKSYRESVYLVSTLPSYVRINWLVGGWVWTRSEYTHVHIHELMFQRIIECGNSVSETKLEKFNWNFTDAQFKQMYSNWIEYIVQTVPAEKLLIYNVKQGIEPLAVFCNVPVPKYLMPNCNASKSFQFYVTVLKTVAKVLYCLITCLLAGLILQSKILVYVALFGYLFLQIIIMIIPQFGSAKPKVD